MFGDVTSHHSPVSFKYPRPEKAPDRPPIARLRRVGLTPELEAEVYRRWEGYTDGERIKAVEDLDLLDDDELRQQVAEMAAELTEEPPAPAEAPTPKKRAARKQTAKKQPRGRSDG